MTDLLEIEEQLKDLSTIESLKTLTQVFPGQVVFSTSMGQEAQVLTDIIFTNNLPVRVFTIDTGRLFAETYELIQLTEEKYGKKIEVFFPEHKDIEQLVNLHGVNCFYKSVENRVECCRVRKIVPFQRAMRGAKVWVTGMRKEQSGYRSTLKKITWNNTYQLIKYNPLIDWKLGEIKDYLEENMVPFNLLHNQGYVSIGCKPCTKTVNVADEIRSGRWWWENSERECGLNL